MSQEERAAFSPMATLDRNKRPAHSKHSALHHNDKTTNIPTKSTKSSNSNNVANLINFDDISPDSNKITMNKNTFVAPNNSTLMDQSPLELKMNEIAQKELKLQKKEFYLNKKIHELEQEKKLNEISIREQELKNKEILLKKMEEQHEAKNIKSVKKVTPKKTSKKIVKKIVESDDDSNSDSPSESDSDSQSEPPTYNFNINTVTSKDLTKIAGIGKVTASNIINGRPYKTYAEISKTIDGVGPQTLRLLKNNTYIEKN